MEMTKAKTMGVLELSVCLVIAGAMAASNAVHAEVNGTTEALGDMFKEVEELMEDTQHKLEDTVNQMDNESAKSGHNVQNLTSDYNSLSSSETGLGNQSVPADKIDKTSGNMTEESRRSRTIILSSVKKNDTDHNCTKDEECCEGQLCVWGQCTKDTTKGEAGTICEYQSDCSSDLCCAFHKALLFPVCISKPTERERCLISANHLLELLSWDLEGEGPREHCPCAGDLQCQHLGRGSFCLKGQSSSEEDLTDTLYSEIDYIV
ncbi:dickkopf-related protein 3a isoform X2 [Hoplias malabaricus]|uniref:dickkopf-related protein 3a isoform X2 n=1 Tax=Hoplias malabaricus TaxID=27720 RepID=UPI00346225AD